MAKKKQSIVSDPYTREYEMVTESGHLIQKGDLVKVSGEHGSTFKFIQFSKNPINDKVWVDCFELHKGVSGPQRSFEPDRIKAVKKRGNRVKRGNSVS